MLSAAIGDLLPAALGVALSPLPVVATVTILSAPRGRPKALAFALGWVVALVAVCVVVLLMAGGPDGGRAGGDRGGGIQVALGVLLLTLALRRWHRRKNDDGEPRWLQAIDRLTVPRAAIIGAALAAVNPKNLALTAAAAVGVARATPTVAGSIVAVTVFVLLASVTVAGPVVFALVAPHAANRPLAGFRSFMSDHATAIVVVVLVLLGAKLIGNGLGVLA